jgi:hypothetical protein
MVCESCRTRRKAGHSLAASQPVRSPSALKTLCLQHGKRSSRMRRVNDRSHGLGSSNDAVLADEWQRASERATRRGRRFGGEEENLKFIARPKADQW